MVRGSESYKEDSVGTVRQVKKNRNCSVKKGKGRQGLPNGLDLSTFSFFS